MRAREIKDLSLALEALSRIPGTDAESLSNRIRFQIDAILTEEENKPEPKPSTYTVKDDEIPL